METNQLTALLAEAVSTNRKTELPGSPDCVATILASHYQRIEAHDLGSIRDDLSPSPLHFTRLAVSAYETAKALQSHTAKAVSCTNIILNNTIDLYFNDKLMKAVIAPALLGFPVLLKLSNDGIIDVQHTPSWEVWSDPLLPQANYCFRLNDIEVGADTYFRNHNCEELASTYFRFQTDVLWRLRGLSIKLSRTRRSAPGCFNINVDMAAASLEGMGNAS